MKARQEGRLHQGSALAKTGQGAWDNRADAMKGWAYIIQALDASESPDDRKLAERVARFVQAAPFYQQAILRQREAAVTPRHQPGLQPQPRKAMDRPGPEIER